MKISTGATRCVRAVLRVLIAAVSVCVVAVSAFAWVQLQVLNRSTSTASVIDGSAVAPTGEQNILLVGVDSRTDAQGNPLPPQLLDALHAGASDEGGDTADSLTVVHVPAGGGRATAISIPRDSYVQLAGDFGKHKINSAYSRGVQAATEQLTGGAGGSSSSAYAPQSAPTPAPTDPAVRRAATAAGARTTIETVEQLTGLRITHYASVNLAGFADVSDAIGGVSVCLRGPVDDSYSGLVLPGGVQQISGAQALAFVRQRHGLPNGDLDRVTRQQVFLAAATDKLLSAGTLANPFALQRLDGVVSRSVTLDAGWNLLGFAQQMQGLRAGAVTFRTIPTGTTELSTPYDGEAVKVDPLAVHSFVAEAVAADAGVPAPAAAPAPAAPTTTPPPVDDARPSTAPATPAPLTAPITAADPGCIN